MSEFTDVVDIIVKWSGSEYKIDGLGATDNVLQLKNLICQATGVLPERQKLFGLKYQGKPPHDEVKIAELSLKPGTKIMMMGTREEVLENIIEPPDTSQSEVVNDFDIEEDEIAIHDREEYLAKIDKRIKTYAFKTLSEPRPNKKLLVLDVDYTLFDHRSMAESGLELMRPFLHEFLTSAYVSFDIVIWSATSMKWIDAKMEELGMLTNPSFNICMVMDDLAMITVDTPTYGVIEVKPLGVIWGRFPQWNETNTIMFDDMRRNFIMNPQSGLKIRPFRNAHLNRSTDRELLRLSDYLKEIADLDDFSVLNHRHWEKFKKKKLLGKRQNNNTD